MKDHNFMKLGRLMFGFGFSAIGIEYAIKAQIGLGPWDILNQGLASRLHLSYGLESILISMLIVAVMLIGGVKVGWGTILNITVTSILIDLIARLNIIPYAQNFQQGIIMSLISMIFTAFGSYYYLSCQLGFGPRDGLMCLLVTKLKISISFARIGSEGIAFLIGWLIGGPAGLGSLIFVIGSGPIMKWVFDAYNFKVQSISN